jgi:malate synthase
MENLSALPDWAKIIGVLFLIIFGGGAGSTIITKMISRKKIESEANLENADAAIKVATANKTTVEVANDLFDQYKELLANEKQHRKELEEDFKKFKIEFGGELVNIKEELSDTKERLENSERRVRYLEAYLKVVKIRWEAITVEPFPQYETVVAMEDLKK